MKNDRLNDYSTYLKGIAYLTRLLFFVESVSTLVRH